MTPSADAATPDRVSPAVLRAVGALGVAPLAVYVVLGVAAALGAPVQLNHDVAQYLTAGQRLLGGAVPFVDLIDTNPPLPIYLGAVPAALAGALGVPLGVAGTAFFAALALGLWAGTLALLHRTGLPPTAALLVTAGWFHVWMTAYAMPEPLGLGQRDLLIGALLVPWALVRDARTAGLAVRPSVAVAVGAGALVAVGMKPHYVLPLLAVEAFLMVDARRWARVRTPEVAAFVVAGVAYAAHVLLVPGMRVFYTYWLPTIQAGYGPAFDAPLPDVLARLTAVSGVWLVASPAVAAAGCLLALGARGLLPRAQTSRAARRAAVLAVLALGSLAVFVIQRKGWSYHLLAFDLAAATACALAAAAVLDAGARRFASDARLARSLALALAGAALLGPVSLALERLPRGEPSRGTETARAIQAVTQPGDRVLTFSHLKAVYPALTLAERPSAGRYLNGFVQTMVLERTPTGYRVRDAWRELEARYRQDFLDDVARQRPALIVVSTTPDLTSAEDYLHGSGLWRQIRADYRRGEPVGALRFYHRR